MEFGSKVRWMEQISQARRTDACHAGVPYRHLRDGVVEQMDE
jgi:hypothetical protein